MQKYIILFFIYLSSQLYFCNSKTFKLGCYNIIRNNILKKIILEDTNRAKLFIQKTKFYYNKLLSKYYEMNEKYYSLSDSELATIEAIISLVY
jgi:hypothetical protein